MFQIGDRPIEHQDAPLTIEQAERIRDCFDRVAPRILVIGDLIIDDFIVGSLLKITDEGPSYVYETKADHFKLGAAANVARNANLAGASVTFLTVTGRDPIGDLPEKIMDAGIDAQLHRIGGQTTVKGRYMVDDRLVFRVDHNMRPWDIANHDYEEFLRRAIALAAGKYDAIILSDYGKGVIRETMLHELFSLREKPKIWGDLKQTDLESIGCFDGMVFPERELARFDRLLARVEYRTRGRNGVQVVLPDKVNDGSGDEQYTSVIREIPALTKHPVSVVGAGDCFIAWACVGMCLGLDPIDAGALANFAAGIGCGKKGHVCASRAEVLNEIDRDI